MTPTTYSYQGQDAFVVEYFGGRRGGFFLDSGASDGRSGSNSKMLEESFGWSGICVEPNDELFAAMAAHRRCHTLNCCLYDRDGEVDFLEAARVFGGIVEAYDPGHLDYARHMIAARWPRDVGAGPVSKPARTIRGILDAVRAPRVIDYWSLDTEGSELALLQSFPFGDYRFELLTVEHNFTPDRHRIRSYLATRGYALVGELGIDDAYAYGAAPMHGHGVGWRSAAFRRSGR